MINFSEYLIENTASSMVISKEQKIAIDNYISQRYCTKDYYTLSMIANYIGNRQSFILSYSSKVWTDLGISEYQFKRVKNWLRENEFIKTLSKKYYKQGYNNNKAEVFEPCTFNFFGQLRRVLEGGKYVHQYNQEDNSNRIFHSYFGDLDISYIQSIQQKINSFIYKKSEFYPLINFSLKQSDKDLAELSGRANSTYCTMPNKNKFHKIEHKLYREDILMKIWETDRILEVDVKSSIPRIARWMNYGIWEPRSIDLYEKIFCKNLIKEFSKDSRDMFKKLFMYLAYSNDFSIAQITSNINAHRIGIYNKETNIWEVEKDEELKDLPKITKEQVKYSLKRIKKICGYIPRNICVIESSLYLTTIDSLLKDGYLKNGQIEFIFDAIEYTDNKLTIDVFEKHLAKCAKYFRDKILNHTITNYPYTLNKTIERVDYYKYNAHWSTTSNHFSEIFGNPDKINLQTWKEIKQTYNIPSKLRLSDIYHLAKAKSMNVQQYISVFYVLPNVTKYGLKTNKTYQNMVCIYLQIKELFGDNKFRKGDVIEFFTSQKQWYNFKDKFLETLPYREYKIKDLSN